MELEVTLQTNIVSMSSRCIKTAKKRKVFDNITLMLPNLFRIFCNSFGCAVFMFPEFKNITNFQRGHDNVSFSPKLNLKRVDNSKYEWNALYPKIELYFYSLELKHQICACQGYYMSGYQ